MFTVQYFFYLSVSSRILTACTGSLATRNVAEYDVSCTSDRSFQEKKTLETRLESILNAFIRWSSLHVTEEKLLIMVLTSTGKYVSLSILPLSLRLRSVNIKHVFGSCFGAPNTLHLELYFFPTKML